MNLVSRLGLAVAVVSACWGGVAAAQVARVDLRPKFIKGHELRYRMTQHSTGSTSIPGLEEEMPGEVVPATRPAPKGVTPPKPATLKPAPPPSEPDEEMSQTTDIRFKVVSVAPDGGATVEMIYDAITVKSRGPLGETDFDSTKPPPKGGDEPGNAALRAVVGTTLTLTIDRDGAITDVKGGENLLPGSVGAPGAAPISGPGVRQAWGPIFTGRKGSGEATLGERWTTTDTLDVSPIGAFTITTESVLTSARAGNADVDFKGRIEPSRESGGGAMGVQIRSATHAGKYTWDVASGSLRTLTMKQAMEAEGTLSGLKFSASRASDTKIERLEGRSSAPSPRPDPAAPSPKDSRPRLR